VGFLLYYMSMLPKNLSSTVRKVIESNPTLFLIDGVYLNPAKANQLSKKMPDLTSSGVNVIETETETENGTIIYAQVKSNIGATLSLGSITLDGSSILGKQDLVFYEDFLTFIEDNATNVS